MVEHRAHDMANQSSYNNSSHRALQKLEGIGAKLAARIVAGRPFRSVEEVAKVRGIGRRRLARLRPRLVLDEE